MSLALNYLLRSSTNIETQQLTVCQVIRATFLGNLSRNIVALQFGIVCCAYYHLLAQQIFMLQKVDIFSTFCDNKICLARRWYCTHKKESQLATQRCCATSCTKMLSVLRGFKHNMRQALSWHRHEYVFVHSFVYVTCVGYINEDRNIHTNISTGRAINSICSCFCS